MARMPDTNEYFGFRVSAGVFTKLEACEPGFVPDHFVGNTRALAGTTTGPNLPSYGAVDSSTAANHQGPLLAPDSDACPRSRQWSRIFPESVADFLF
jgi:hypothetical protein